MTDQPKTAKQPPAPVDTILRGGTVLTMDAARRIYAPGSVAIRGNAIVAAGPTEAIDVAYTTHEDFQGLGLGTMLQGHLEAYAKKMGFRGAVGYLFEDNVAMLKTFARKGQYQGEILEDGILRVWRYFNGNGEEHPDPSP